MTAPSERRPSGPPTDAELASMIDDLQSTTRRVYTDRNPLSRQERAYTPLVRFLARAGRAVCTPTGAIRLGPRGEALRPGSPELYAYLVTTSGLPAGALEATRAMDAAVQTVCYRQGALRGRIVLLSAVDNDGGVCIRANDRCMVCIEGGARTVVNNGHDLLVIPNDDTFEPLRKLPPPSERLFEGLIDTIALDFVFEGMDSRQGALLLVLSMAYFLLPRQLSGIRPLLLLLGAGADGKSTLAWMLARLICGEAAAIEAPPERQRQRDLETLLAGVSLVVLEDFPLASYSALMRAIASGSKRRTRRMYSDNDLNVQNPDCRLIVTGTTSPASRTRADTAVLVPVFLGPIERMCRLPEGHFDQVAREMRPQFYSDAFELLRQVLDSNWLSHQRPAESRLARYESFLLASADRLKMANVVATALDHLDVARHGLVVDDDLLADSLVELVEKEPFEGTCTELLNKFRGTRQANVRNVAWDGWTPAVLGRRLAEIAPAMLCAHSVLIRQVPRTGCARKWRIEVQPPDGDDWTGADE